jgi:HSP20 family protein
MGLERFGTAHDIQELLTVRDDIEGLLEEHHDTSLPRADLIDDGEAYRVILEVPGIAEANLELALEKEKLIVAGVRESFTEEARHLINERQLGPFQRTFELPGDYDAERVSAHLQAGLLVVVLPKA